MFVLGALFSVLFIGIPPNVFSWGILVNIVVAFNICIYDGYFFSIHSSIYKQTIIANYCWNIFTWSISYCNWSIMR